MTQVPLVLLLSDEESNDSLDDLPSLMDRVKDTSKKEDEWNGNSLPRIVSSQSIRSESASDSGFSGFSSQVNGERSHCDLEIVEEVIREIRPGSVPSNIKRLKRIPYRERKMDFKWVNVKKEEPEKDSPTKLSNEDIMTPNSQNSSIANNLVNSGQTNQRRSSSENETSIQETPTSSKKKRLIATMKPSSIFSSNKKQKTKETEKNSRSSSTNNGFDQEGLDEVTDEDKQMTGFIIFSQKVRRKLTRENPTYEFKDISHLICNDWMRLSEAERKDHELKAHQLNLEITHRKEKSREDVNGQILFAAEIRKSVTEDHPTRNFREISRAIGQEWNRLGDTKRKLYKDMAIQLCQERELTNEPNSAQASETSRHRTQTDTGRRFCVASPASSPEHVSSSSPWVGRDAIDEVIPEKESRKVSRSGLANKTVNERSEEHPSSSRVRDEEVNSNSLSESSLSSSSSSSESEFESESSDDKGDNSRKDKKTKENGSLKTAYSRFPKRSTNIISNHDFGRLVWGKTGSCRPWPAVIVSSNDCGEKPPQGDKAWLLWFGDYRITKVNLSSIQDFVTNFKGQFVKSYQESYRRAIFDCLKECRDRAELELLDKAALLKWAENGLSGLKDGNPTKGISQNIKRCLSRIHKMRTRENMSSSEASFFPTSSSNGAASDSCAEARNSWKPKASLLKAVRYGKHDIETLCIACNRVDCEVVAPHPYFLGGTCSACKDELEDLSGFVADGTSMYCVICGSPGELFVCDHGDCEKVFCSGCVELLVSPKAVDVITETDPWFCFLCEPYNLITHGLLKPRPNWQEKTNKNDQQQKLMDLPEVEDETPPLSSFPQRPIRVLSLFDGISTGLFVLEKLGLDVEVYYASEIHESAKNVSSINFGSKITQIGDVQTVTDKQIAEICPIDLLIGGSPCNDLSFVNPNRKGLFDPTGTGILFFHYFRALKTIEKFNKDTKTHLFWLFENVNHMPREFKTHINSFLQRDPVVIDAKFFSPQSRPRCFWGNIPDMYKPLPESVLKKTYPLDDFVTKIGNRKALFDKVNCVTTNVNSLRQVIQMNDHADIPWITELEKIFGFPAHYTDVGNLNNRERQALLGRSWSVAVIEYILKPLTGYFSVVSDKFKTPDRDLHKKQNTLRSKE